MPKNKTTSITRHLGARGVNGIIAGQWLFFH